MSTVPGRRLSCVRGFRALVVGGAGRLLAAAVVLGTASWLPARGQGPTTTPGSAGGGRDSLRFPTSLPTSLPTSMPAEFQSMFQHIQGAPAVGVGIGAMVMGLLACFWGFSLYKVAIVLFGLFTGISAGLMFGIGGNAIAGVLFGVVAGLVFAGIALWMSMVGVFLLGMAMSLLVSILVVRAAGLMYVNSPWVVVPFIAGIVGGFLAVRWHRPIIVLTTAFGGGAITALGAAAALGLDVDTLLRAPDLSATPVWATVGGALALGLFGTMAQFRRIVHKATAVAEAQGVVQPNTVIILLDPGRQKP